jgi:hypothetical protein
MSLVEFLSKNHHHQCAFIHWRSEPDPEAIHADWLRIKEAVHAIGSAASSEGIGKAGDCSNTSSSSTSTAAIPVSWEIQLSGTSGQLLEFYSTSAIAYGI